MTNTKTFAGLYLFALVVATNILCTQFIAVKFDYHPALGAPLYGHIYNPLAWWRWAFTFYDHSPTIYIQAFALCGAGILVTFVGLAFIVGIRSRSSKKHEGVHGTAHFATLEDVKNTGLFPQPGKTGAGVYVGGYDDPKTSVTQYLRHNGPEHILVTAPPRSGKGVGIVIPTLLSWPHSLFVLDIKGENYAMTAGWRKEGGNNTVLRFEPAADGVGCAWNALEEIRFQTTYEISDAQKIALIVIDTDGKGISVDHWRMAGFELLCGVIMHALYKSSTVGRLPGLSDCAHMLTQTGDFSPPTTPESEERPLQLLFTEMANVTLDGLLAGQEAQLFIRSIGRSQLNKAPKELASIISTVNNALSLYRDPKVARNTSHSDFKVSDLMDSEKPVSLYFITNPDDLDRIKPLTRLLLTQIVSRLAGRMEFDDGRSKTTHKHRLLLMLDEFPALGKLEVFQGALAYIAGYGIKACIITQDIQQLYAAYTQHETILSNCHIRIAYTPAKLETAEWLSKMTGQTTVITKQVSTSGKRFGLFLPQASVSFQEKPRYLMTPNEVATMEGPTKDGNGNILKAGKMLIFVAGQQVILGRQILYFLDPTFSARSKIPPPKGSDTIRRTGFTVQ